jgi:LacI family transcriptional regulator
VSSSIKDVARLAGVSVATVSHVINETRFVTEATRDKVLAAIGDLQYSPNILARKFKTGSRDTVGFVVPDIANGYFATLIEEVEDVLQARGFRMIVSNTRENVARELDSLRMLSSGVVDGLMIASAVDDYREIAAVLPTDFPVVLIDRALANAPVDVVTTDNSGAIYEGVSALIGRGHQRIGFMASVRHLSTTAERVLAYRAALKDHAIAVDDGLIRYVDSITDPVQPSAQALIHQGCTAIVASNNVLTGKLLAALHAGAWSDQDVEILGYRDPAHGAYPHDGAQWLEEPIGEMGRIAAEAILRRVADPQAEPRETVLRAAYAAKEPAVGDVKHT